MSHENPQICARAQARRARMHCHARGSMSPRAPRALQGCLLGWAASSYFFENVPPLTYAYSYKYHLTPPPPRFSSQLPSQFQKSRCHGRGLWWPSFAHLRQELACPGLKRRCHIARVAPDSRDGTRASREMRITRAKGVRYVILREFHVSEQSHVDSRAFLRIKNLNRDA